jgi:hypothetical protein
MDYFVFGLQRSGTNYLEQLITQNFKARRANRANKSWKHAIDVPKHYNASQPTFIIYKNPYTWVESICIRNTVDWLKTQKTYPVEQGPEDLRLGPNNINVESLAKTYKHFHDTWLWSTLDKSSTQVFKYESLLVDNSREQALNQVSQLLPVRKANHWINPQRGKISQSKDYNEDREQYYLSMQAQQLTHRHIDAINDVLGNDIERMGYEKL